MQNCKRQELEKLLQVKERAENNESVHLKSFFKLKKNVGNIGSRNLISLTNSFTHSLTHSVTHLLSHLVTHSVSQSFSQSVSQSQAQENNKIKSLKKALEFIKRHTLEKVYIHLKKRGKVMKRYALEKFL